MFNVSIRELPVYFNLHLSQTSAALWLLFFFYSSGFTLTQSFLQQFQLQQLRISHYCCVNEDNTISTWTQNKSQTSMFCSKLLTWAPAQPPSAPHSAHPSIPLSPFLGIQNFQPFVWSSIRSLFISTELDIFKQRKLFMHLKTNCFLAYYYVGHVILANICVVHICK